MLILPIIPKKQKVYFRVLADEAMEQNKGRTQKRAFPKRETMKTMLLAAAAALSLGVSSAYADGGQGPVAKSYFTELPGVIAHAPGQNAPAVATARNGQAIGIYVTHSDSASPFLLNSTK